MGVLSKLALAGAVLPCALANSKTEINPFSDSTKHYVMGTLEERIANTTKLLKDVENSYYNNIADGSSKLSVKDAHSFASQADGDAVSAFLEKLKMQPSAYWIDVKEKIWKGSLNPRDHNKPFADLETVEGILDDAVAKGNDMITFIVYDLPNRDCQALASNGQLCCDGSVTLGESPCSGVSISGSNCDAGMKVYKSQYVDELFKVFSKYTDKIKNLVLIIEPDSLPNATTGTTEICRSQATIAGYKEGIAYAIGKFSTLDNAVMYVDAAHGGWMGWTQNIDGFAQNMKAMTVPSDAGNSNAGQPVMNYVRGFAINTANYEPDEDLNDYENLLGDWNCAINNVAYATGENKNCAGGLIKDCSAIPQEKRQKCISLKDYFPGKGFVIDSGRNGNPCARKGATERETWCNPTKSAIGKFPTSSTGYEMVDAFYWLKTPGESDGCSFDGCPRLDRNCQLENCMGKPGTKVPYAPEAGLWYPYQIIELAKDNVLEDKFFPGCKPTDMKTRNPFIPGSGMGFHEAIYV